MITVRSKEYNELISSGLFTALDFSFSLILNNGEEKRKDTIYVLASSAEKRYLEYKKMTNNSLKVFSEEFDSSNSVTTIQYDRLDDSVLKNYSAMYRIFDKTGIITTMFVNKNNLVANPYVRIFRKGTGVVSVHVSNILPTDVVSSNWLKEHKAKMLKDMLNV